MKILLLTMGGTIDAEAYPEDENLYPVDATPQGSNASYEVVKSFSSAERNIDVKHIKICDKDSKHYNDNDRNALLEAIISDGGHSDRVIVTTGTDRMVETAKWLKQEVQKHDIKLKCPVVFSGAIWPLDNGPEKSDGFKNLKQAALFSTQSLFSDIYVTVGDIFMFADHVKKDFEAKKFTFTS